MNMHGILSCSFFFFYIILSCSCSAASRSTVRNQTPVLACKNLWIGQCLYALTVGEDLGGGTCPHLFFYFSFLITNFAMLLSFFFFLRSTSSSNSATKYDEIKLCAPSKINGLFRGGSKILFNIQFKKKKILFNMDQKTLMVKKRSKNGYQVKLNHD